MKFLVTYASHPSASTMRAIRRALGSQPQLGTVLPVVSMPFATDEEAEERRALLLESWVPGPEEAVLIQPELSELPRMEQAVAIALAKRHEETEQFLDEVAREHSAVKFRVKEHPRCYVVAIYVSSGGIPPGLGILVDKASGRVFPRRFVDVMDGSGEVI